MSFKWITKEGFVKICDNCKSEDNVRTTRLTIALTTPGLADLVTRQTQKDLCPVCRRSKEIAFTGSESWDTSKTKACSDFTMDEAICRATKVLGVDPILGKTLLRRIEHELEAMSKSKPESEPTLEQAEENRLPVALETATARATIALHLPPTVRRRSRAFMARVVHELSLMGLKLEFTEAVVKPKYKSGMALKALMDQNDVYMDLKLAAGRAALYYGMSSTGGTDIGRAFLSRVQLELDILDAAKPEPTQLFPQDLLDRAKSEATQGQLGCHHPSCRAKAETAECSPMMIPDVEFRRRVSTTFTSLLRRVGKLERGA